MIELIQHNKITVLVIALVVAGASWFVMTQDASSSSLTTTEVTADGGADAELVTTLLALRAIKLDGTIFSDPAFVSLQDFSTQIVPEPVGRKNPFAPLNNGSVSPSATNASTTQSQIFGPAQNSRTTPVKRGTATGR